MIRTATPGTTSYTANNLNQYTTVGGVTPATTPTAITQNRLTTKTPPSGPVVSNTYDLVGRLKSASDNSSAIPSAVSPTGSPIAYITNLTYDAMNRPITTTWD